MKIAILTSGGDAPGMNAAVRAVVKMAASLGHEVYGVKEGYKGLVEDNLILLTPLMVDPYLSVSGTFLKSARLPEFQQPEVQAKAVENLNRRGIKNLIVCGGDGSYHAAERLSHDGLNVIGLPGTIDNDLGGTDFTIGFHTAKNTIVEAIDAISDTAKSHNRCYVLEVMGRYCGDLALYAGLAGGADVIVSRDNPLTHEEVANRVKKVFESGKDYSVVVVTEHNTDVHQLAKDIETKTGVITRATVLGYMQRGGRPVPEDRILATRLGGYAVELLDQGKSGLACGISGDKVVTVTLKEAITLKRDRKQDYLFAQKVA